jgi:porin
VICVRRVLLVATLTFGWHSTHAIEPPAPFTSHGNEMKPPDERNEPLDKVLQQPWFGSWEPRARLAEEGVTLIGQYIGEPAWNDRGYKDTGWTYAQEVDFGAVLNLRKLGWADAGVVRVLLSDRIGTAAHQNTGAYIQDQAYWGQGQNFRLDEVSYERSYLSNRLNVKGGFYSMGNDFGGLPDVCNFNTNGTCGHPLGPLYGSGWLDSPTGGWGGRLKWAASSSGWYAQAGVYDVTPARKQHSQGFNLDFSNTTGVIVPMEVGYVHGKTPDDYPGTYKIEAYYDSSTLTNLANSSRKVSGRTGGYIQGAQQIWKPSPGVVQGLSVFAVASLADPESGLFRTYYEAGLSWRGPLPARYDDWVSLAWMQANVNSAVRSAEERAGKPGQTNEQLIELNYTWQGTPWLLVRPAFQYAVRPGGYSTRPDTLIFSMHIQITF